jgi:hypothetical protein
LYDPLYRIKAESNDIGIPGSRVSLEYKYIGKEYRPYYRQDAAAFDQDEVDQEGYDAIMTQKLGGFVLSGEYFDIVRISKAKDYTYKSRYGIGYYGYAGTDMSLSFQQTRYKYATTYTRVNWAPLNWDYFGSLAEIYVRHQLNPKMAVMVKMQCADTQDQDTVAVAPKYFTNSFYAKYEYDFSTNAKLFVEYMTTRYPQRSWEPQGWPYDDNYARISFDLTF